MDWELKPGDGTVIATNRETGEIFEGNIDAVNAKINSPHKDSFSRKLSKKDLERLLSSDSEYAVVYTIPPDSELGDLTVGTTIAAAQASSGLVSFAGALGVGIEGTPRTSTMFGSPIGVYWIGANTWVHI